MNIEIKYKNREYLQISFPYNQKLVEAMRIVPGRHWDTEKKHWLIRDNDKSLQLFLNEVYKLGSFNCVDYPPADDSQDEEDSELEKYINKTIRYLKFKEYSQRTIKAYSNQIEWFFRRSALSPAEVRTEDIILYLEKIKDIAGCSRTYAVQCVSALKCFYKQSFPQLLNPAGRVPLPKKDSKLPDILSREEVKQIIDSNTNIKHKFLLLVIYSAGLRVGEAVNLKVADLDFMRKLIHIREGKGRKDRYIMLSENVIKLYREYSKQVMLHEWLFPATRPDKHLSIRSAQNVFYAAAEKIGTNKNVSIHSLRHAFATHLLEDGVDLRYIQELLGHKSSRTTEIYTHVSRFDIKKISSPADKW